MYIEFQISTNKIKYYTLTYLLCLSSILIFAIPYDNVDEEYNIPVKVLLLQFYSILSMYYIILLISPWNKELVFNNSYRVIIYILCTIYLTLSFSYSNMFGLYTNIIAIWNIHWVYKMMIHFIFTTYLAYFTFICFMIWNFYSLRNMARERPSYAIV
jgi:hypothetical protein